MQAVAMFVICFRVENLLYQNNHEIELLKNSHQNNRLFMKIAKRLIDFSVIKWHIDLIATYGSINS